MMLYRVVNRALEPVRELTGPETASLGPDSDSWLRARGYGHEFTLRRGIVREVSNGERRAMSIECARLKRQGKVPSAATAILAKLAIEKGV